jgi:DNA-binding transcriptional ArsR family regulator
MIKTNKHSSIAKVSDLLQVIGPEPCLKILLAIGTGEACVCHLKAVLGYRQAYISQHLMELREAGLLESRRNGKYIFYHLAKPEILELLQNAAKIARVDLVKPDPARHEKLCACPHCVSVIPTPLLAEHAN